MSRYRIETFNWHGRQRQGWDVQARGDDLETMRLAALEAARRHPVRLIDTKSPGSYDGQTMRYKECTLFTNETGREL